MSAEVDQRGRKLTDALTQRSGELRQLFDREGALLVDLLSARGGEVAQALAGAGESLATTIDERATHLLSGLDARLGDLDGRIVGFDDKGAEISAAVARAAMETPN